MNRYIYQRKNGTFFRISRKCAFFFKKIVKNILREGVQPADGRELFFKYRITQAVKTAVEFAVRTLY